MSEQGSKGEKSGSSRRRGGAGGEGSKAKKLSETSKGDGGVRHRLVKKEGDGQSVFVVKSEEGEERGRGRVKKIKEPKRPLSARSLPPSSASPEETGRRRRRRGRRGEKGETKDKDFAPSSRSREVQQSIKDLFPVRRSTRKCKAVLESEEFEKTAEKLRTKNEEGLKVVEVEGKGRGVVSARPFKKGELICEYSGELISHEEAKKREELYSQDTDIGCYMYYYEFKTKKLCVDATKDNGRLGRLLNHSKTAANVVTKVMEVDEKPYLCLMAARDVTVGEELQYDYGERNKEALDSHPWLAS